MLPRSRWFLQANAAKATQPPAAGSKWTGIGRISSRIRPFSFSLFPPADDKTPTKPSPFVSVMPSSSQSVNTLCLTFMADMKSEQSRQEPEGGGRVRTKRAKDESALTLSEVTPKKESFKQQLLTKNSSRRQTPETLTCVEQNNDAEQKLQKWYEAQYGIAFKDKCLTMKKVLVKDEVLGVSNEKWKAQFTCPISKEAFLCGTLADVWENYRLDGEIVYNRMKHARQAVVARALDCFRFREDEHTAESRICVEVPYKFGEKVKEMPRAPTSVTDQVDSDEENDVLSIDRVEDKSENGFLSDGDDDADDKEYTIQYLYATSQNEAPQGPQQAASNPLARVIGSFPDETTETLQPDWVAPFSTTHPEDELKLLVENASEWIEKEQASQVECLRDQHRVMLRGYEVSLGIANSILDGLSKAHWRVSFQAQPRGVEQVATKILNHLRSTRSAHPNADTVVAYLGCLEGEDALSRATRASEFLDAMSQGDTEDAVGEKSMPKPTIAVVNAVLRLWAQVGGESGRTMNIGNIEKPNRESFLLLLSTMSYPPTVEGEIGGFDPIFAQECIDSMKAASLSLDTSVYNAGLRWSGGVQSSLSRPYMRPVPWDSHAEIFRNGFQAFDEDSAKVQEAYRMYAWLEEMTRRGDSVAPNIETYEAVIQAYVRTGSLDGVQHAEILLESLLDDSPSSDCVPTPRLQTFHPIIAAWANSGHDQSLRKVSKWIDRLHSLSKGKKESQEFDRHVAEATLVANANWIVKVLRSQKQFSISEINNLVDRALGCSIHLKDLCSILQKGEGKDISPILDSRAFVLVVQVWGILGLHFLQTAKTSEESKHAFEKMYETVEEYERLISSVRKRNTSQTYYLISNFHEVYSTICRALHEAGAATRTNGSDWSMGAYIGDLERWVRRINEFGVIRACERTVNNDRAYSDMYSYLAGATLPPDCSENQVDFMMQILEFLRFDVPDPSMSWRGDMVRLSFLVLEVLPFILRNPSPANTNGTRPFSLVSAHTEVVKAICHLGIGQYEQKALLDRLRLYADLLFQKRLCSESDHDLMIKEVQRHSSSVPVRKPGGTRTTRRSDASQARAHHQTPEGHGDPVDVDAKTMLQIQ